MSTGVEYSTAVVFLCSDCGAAYKAVQQYAELSQLGNFDCSECNSLVHSWHGVYTYCAWTPIFAEKPARSRRLAKRLKMNGAATYAAALDTSGRTKAPGNGER